MSLTQLSKTIRQCRICAEALPHAPRPVFQIHQKARILIAGQAPGRKVHESGIPFDDQSGVRLRDWMGISEQLFYDAQQIAILPMGFCYPGQGRSGDLPPRQECAAEWRAKLLAQLPQVKLTLLIGQYALRWHLAERMQASLTETVSAWQDYLPEYLPLPHPSPRNNIWLSKNPWFEKQLLPVLRRRVRNILSKR